MSGITGRGRQEDAGIAETDHLRDRQDAEVAETEAMPVAACGRAKRGTGIASAIFAPQRSLRLIVSVISMISVAGVSL
jgi:hypothetical protein